MAPKRAHDQLGCALSAIHITATLLDASCNDFCALLLSRKGVNVCGNWAQTRMQYCKLGFFARKQWCQTGFSPWRAVFLLQWNSCEPFNWATKLVIGTREKSFSSFPLPFSSMLNLLVQRAVQDLILFYPFSCPSTQLRQTQLDVIF